MGFLFNTMSGSAAIAHARASKLRKLRLQRSLAGRKGGMAGSIASKRRAARMRWAGMATLAKLARQYRMPPAVLRRRILRGWGLESSLTTPLRRRKKS